MIIASSVGLLVLVIGAYAFLHNRRQGHLNTHPDATMEGWKPIGGSWDKHGDVFSNSNYGRGDMLIAQNSENKNYSISADMRFDLLFPETHYGDAGLVIRTTNPERGVDSYQGYYAGLRADDQVIVLGRASYDWHQLKVVHLDNPIATGVWYHLVLSVTDCNISMTATRSDTGKTSRLDYTDKNCLTEGVAGLRSFYAQASWRNVQITPR